MHFCNSSFKMRSQVQSENISISKIYIHKYILKNDKMYRLIKLAKHFFYNDVHYLISIVFYSKFTESSI